MVNNWVEQGDYTSFVYALDGEQVFALDGSPVQFGSFWIDQTSENENWIDQT